MELVRVINTLSNTLGTETTVPAPVVSNPLIELKPQSITSNSSRHNQHHYDTCHNIMTLRSDAISSPTFQLYILEGMILHKS
jgi:hypothetical protein